MIRAILVICTIFFSFVSAKMPSTEEMISQMIVVGFSGTKSTDKWVEQISNDIVKNKIGGVILYNDNVQNPKQLQSLIAHLSSIKSDIPIFVGIEEMGGEHQILSLEKGFYEFQSEKVVAQKNTLTEAYDIYKNVAEELKNNGFNINFGPSVDLLEDSNKSYSLMEELVIAYSSEFINAYDDMGVTTVLKHFPGTNGDTWDYKELKPYYHFIKYNRAAAIMVGHSTLEQFDEKNPASLSKIVITDLLRNKLNFKGVVFSQDMKESTISENYLLKDSIIKAVNAGVDILLYSSYFSKNSNTPKIVRSVILDAIKSGEIDKQLIESSYKRILELKKVLIK